MCIFMSASRKWELAFNSQFKSFDICARFLIMKAPTVDRFNKQNTTQHVHSETINYLYEMLLFA